MVVMIASPLVFRSKTIMLRLGIFTALILALVYYLRVYPALYNPSSYIPEISNMALLLTIAVILNYFTFRTTQQLVALLEDENLRIHVHQQNLEFSAFEKSAQISSTLEKLRKQEELYRSIVENSHDGIVIIDDSSKIVFVNSEMCRLVGYSSDEIIGRTFLDFVDEESRGIAAERYQRRQRGESVPPYMKQRL